MQYFSSYLLRLVVLLCIAAVLASQLYTQRGPRPLHLPAQQQVATNNPKIGIHTRMAGTGDEAAIQRTFAQVREMGAPWAVELFPWAYAQPRSRYGYDRA
ncbi:hypothetical protein SE17_22935, partial [Kouleothrix aurantiaca]